MQSGWEHEAQTTSRVYLPKGPEQVVEQAKLAVQRAWQDGMRRQSLELLLPLIGATDLDDWPGGVRQQAKAAMPMVESLLRELKQAPDLQGPLRGEVIDQGDAVSAWTGDNLAAVLFPTAETLRQVREIAEARSQGLVLLVNAQWQGGQAISDFGVGPWRRRTEAFLGSFTETYSLRQFRIFGDNVRLLKAYPNDWQVWLAREDGEPECISTQATKPTYRELETLLRATEGSNSGLTWVQRLQSEFAFNKKALDR
ncbi:hypothetical protein WJX81_003422 [Elliptochloris bilobata]|uniref:DUF1995 domain-containing protein n=1 Tax=Elliptochloris bilobata TaxID=381761 RepID=A0AAW1QVD2_9CHLO